MVQALLVRLQNLAQLEGLLGHALDTLPSSPNFYLSAALQPPAQPHHTSQVSLRLPSAAHWEAHRLPLPSL